jgi:hypothetical protein
MTTFYCISEGHVKYYVLLYFRRACGILRFTVLQKVCGILRFTVFHTECLMIQVCIMLLEGQLVKRNIPFSNILLFYLDAV